MNILSSKKRQAVLSALMSGKSVRETANEVGVSKVTVSRYRQLIAAAELLGDDLRLPKCQCGQQSGHNGWCSARVKKSPKRQKFLAEWRKPI